jgi:hypothetical protein
MWIHLMTVLRYITGGSENVKRLSIIDIMSTCMGSYLGNFGSRYLGSFLHKLANPNGMLMLKDDLSRGYLSVRAEQVSLCMSMSETQALVVVLQYTGEPFSVSLMEVSALHTLSTPEYICYLIQTGTLIHLVARMYGCSDSPNVIQYYELTTAYGISALCNYSKNMGFDLGHLARN